MRRIARCYRVCAASSGSTTEITAAPVTSSQSLPQTLQGTTVPYRMSSASEMRKPVCVDCWAPFSCRQASVETLHKHRCLHTTMFDCAELTARARSSRTANGDTLCDPSYGDFPEGARSKRVLSAGFCCRQIRSRYSCCASSEPSPSRFPGNIFVQKGREAVGMVTAEKKVRAATSLGSVKVVDGHGAGSAPLASDLPQRPQTVAA